MHYEYKFNAKVFFTDMTLNITEEIIAELAAIQAQVQALDSSAKATKMKRIDGATDSEEPLEATDLEDLFEDKQMRAKLYKIFEVALNLIDQHREPVEPNAFEYTMQRFQKLVLMSEKAAERTRIIVQKVYWASRDALHYNTATAMAYQELEVLSTVPLEGGEKSNEEITAIHQQMLDIIQRCLECRTKSIKEEQNVEALVISAIQYFEEE